MTREAGPTRHRVKVHDLNSTTENPMIKAEFEDGQNINVVPNFKTYNFHVELFTRFCLDFLLRANLWKDQIFA